MSVAKDAGRETLRAPALAAARAVVEAEGLHALSARRIANEIGCSVGTLYNLFRDRDDLVDRLNMQTLEDLSDVCRKAAASPHDPLQALAEAYCAFARANPNRYLALYEHRRKDLARPPKWFASKVEALLDLLRHVLARDKPTADDVDARVLWSAIHGVVVLEISDKLGGRSGAALAERLVELWRAAT